MFEMLSRLDEYRECSGEHLKKLLVGNKQCLELISSADCLENYAVLRARMSIEEGHFKPGTETYDWWHETIMKNKSLEDLKEHVIGVISDLETVLNEK